MPCERMQNGPTEAGDVPAAPPLPGISPLDSATTREKRGAGLRLVVVALILFLGYKVVPLYYYYFDLKSNCSRVLRNASVESDEELRRDLLEVAQRHGVEATTRDIGIQRVGSRIKIWLHYQERLEVAFKGRALTLYTFDFTPSAERVVGE